MPKTRAIAFYLPQYHPVQENDEWWGKGFTEWTNVTRATPKFRGHYQPHLPEELGFYDLRLPETRQAQADLAREHGIHGFCYYHYWFNGRRILERPFNEVLESQKPDFPFCLCWANENWTRAWDGNDRDVLLQQNYSHQDDIEHIRSLIPAFRDKRYIRIDNKPLFLVYRSHLLPNPIETARLWQEEMKSAGFDGIYLARVEDYESVKAGISANDVNFDADVEFPPFSWAMGNVMFRSPLEKILCKLGILPKQLAQNTLIDYEDMAQGIQNRTASKSVRFPGVTPSWDNSARRNTGANIFTDSTPAKYEKWLHKAVEKSTLNPSNDEHIVFINAWNEWAEGNHLEPDLKWGDAYLKATQRALINTALKKTDTKPNTSQTVPGEKTALSISALKNAYWFFGSTVKKFTGLYKYFRHWR